MRKLINSFKRWVFDKASRWLYGKNLAETLADSCLKTTQWEIHCMFMEQSRDKCLNIMRSQNETIMKLRDVIRLERLKTGMNKLGIMLKDDLWYLKDKEGDNDNL